MVITLDATVVPPLRKVAISGGEGSRGEQAARTEGRPSSLRSMAEMSAPRRRTLILLVVAALVVARIALGFFTWAPGWSALTWDDFTRVAIARQWADAPFWFNGFVWLPLPVWITGSVYTVAGGWFASSPMALMAIINTVAVFIAAAIAAWSAHRMFSDTIGTLTVFVVVLFAPLSYFLSLSGLAEPLYFVAIATAAAGFV